MKYYTQEKCKVCSLTTGERLIVERLRFCDKLTLQVICDDINSRWNMTPPSEQAVGKLSTANLSSHFSKHADEEGFWKEYEKFYGKQFAENMKRKCK